MNLSDDRVCPLGPSPPLSLATEREQPPGNTWSERTLEKLMEKIHRMEARTQFHSVQLQRVHDAMADISDELVRVADEVHEDHEILRGDQPRRDSREPREPRRQPTSREVLASMEAEAVRLAEDEAARRPGGLAVTLSAQDRDYKQSAHAQSLEELDRALNSDPLPRRAHSHPLVPLPNPFAAVTKPFGAVKNPFAGMRSPFAPSTTTQTEQAAGGISHGYLPRQLSWATERKPVSSSV